LLTTRRRLRQGLTSPLWTRLSCRVEKLDPIGRDAPLRVDQIHSPCFHLHRQEILDRILLLEEPLWERNVRRPALGLYVVQRVGPAELQRDQVVQFADLTLARVI
jgi:hypothetical protein